MASNYKKKGKPLRLTLYILSPSRSSIYSAAAYNADTA
jgi:hypothetical protein